MLPRPMGTTPEAILARLEPGIETPAGAVRGLATIAEALAADGLVTLRRDGRKVWVTLTAAGEAQRARSLSGPRTRATTVRPRSRTETAERLADRVAALEAQVAALSTRLEALQARLGDGAGDGVGDGDGVGALATTILASISDLDARLRLGGIVPIPELRQELRDRGERADDAAVSRALEMLERDWKIDLAAAQAPTQVANRRAGIERPGRGLLYYIARR